MSDVGDWLSEFWDTWSFEIFASVLTIIVAIVVLVLLRKALERWIGRVQRKYNESHDHMDREQGQRIVTITHAVQLVIAVVVWGVVVLTIMAIWGIPLAPLVAVGATLGVGIGFGAQDFIKDVIGGFFVLVEDQYSVGDVIAVEGVSGTVEAITLRTTVLRNLDGNRHHVPNGHGGVTTNLTSDFTRIVIDVPVAYDTDLDHAMHVLEDVASAMSVEDEWKVSFLDEPVMLGVQELDSSSVNLRLLITTVGDDQWAIRRELLKRIKQRCDAEAIEIPYQYVNVVSTSGGNQSS
jgi:small conductance mechanosensitive channel